MSENAVDIRNHIKHRLPRCLCEMFRAKFSILLLPVSRNDAAGRIDNRAEAIVIEISPQIFRLTALRTITRNEDISIWHPAAQHSAHLRVRRADHAADIADTIYQQLGRTCTFISAEGLISGSTKTVLYCVITRVEVSQLKRIISEADVSAFVTISEVSEIIGNHVKSSSAAIDEKALNQ